eukprot:TRINITY_DN5958_c0_g1_i2.p1 TRINITY_DN5958_c0_g1~~TRINITY_DN5958_c0_g1_i2.p1  ORF type:complete len:305 (+),score=40.99 TRINITY_DN5958_c0_g1_i2:66-980(+)
MDEEGVERGTGDHSVKIELTDDVNLIDKSKIPLVKSPKPSMPAIERAQFYDNLPKVEISLTNNQFKVELHNYHYPNSHEVLLYIQNILSKGGYLVEHWKIQEKIQKKRKEKFHTILALPTTILRHDIGDSSSSFPFLGRIPNVSIPQEKVFVLRDDGQLDEEFANVPPPQFSNSVVSPTNCRNDPFPQTLQSPSPLRPATLRKNETLFEIIPTFDIGNIDQLRSAFQLDVNKRNLNRDPNSEKKSNMSKRSNVSSQAKLSQYIMQMYNRHSHTPEKFGMKPNLSPKLVRSLIHHRNWDELRKNW